MADVLGFHWADGAAERYRRVSFESIVSAYAEGGDDSLLALVDGTGVRRVPPEGDDIDTHLGIFARWTGSPRADELAHCDAWERRLESVHGQHRVTLPDGVGGRAATPSAGPEGSFVVTSLAAGSHVAEWGRPQAGMFVARLAPALAARDGATPSVDELRRRADTLQRRGVVMADVVGHDAGNRNAAARPPLTPHRLEAHGRTATSLADLRLDLDAHGRPWIVDPNGQRLLPTYQSAATIGATDPCSWLLLRLAMAHGWEFVSFGFPALPAERSRWHHLPRLELGGGTVVSAERWTIPGETLRRLAAADDVERYLEWTAEVKRLGLPTFVRVRWDPHPAAPPVLTATASPLTAPDSAALPTLRLAVVVPS